MAGSGRRRNKITLSHEELMLLLGGIDLAQTRRRRMASRDSRSIKKYRNKYARICFNLARDRLS